PAATALGATAWLDGAGPGRFRQRLRTGLAMATDELRLSRRLGMDRFHRRLPRRAVHRAAARELAGRASGGRAIQASTGGAAAFRLAVPAGAVRPVAGVRR